MRDMLIQDPTGVNPRWKNVGVWGVKSQISGLSRVIQLGNVGDASSRLLAADNVE